MISRGPRPAAGRGARSGAPVAVASQHVLDLDLVLRRLAALHCRLVPASARAAHVLRKAKAWTKKFGYAHASDFSREKWGRSGRWFEDRAALGAVLVKFPALERAMTGADGREPLGSAAALVVGRAAGEDLELWIARARRMSVRALKEAVRRAKGEAALPRDRDDEDDEKRPVQISMPGKLHVAFEDGLHLHRAVTGHESRVEEFLEALIGEAPPWAMARVEPCAAESGARPPQRATGPPILRGGSEWPSLPSPAMREAWDCIRRLERVVRRVPSPDLDCERLVRDVLHLEDEIEVLMGRLLAELGAERAWRELGCSLEEYGETRLGLSRTATGRRARIVGRLREMDAVRQAYFDGRIGIEAAETIRSALGRRADVAVQEAWVARAERVTLKDLHDDEALARRTRHLEARVIEPPTPEERRASIRRFPGKTLLDLVELGYQVLADVRARKPGSDVCGPWSRTGSDVCGLRLRLHAETATALESVLEAVRQGLIEEAKRLDQEPPDVAARAWPSVRITQALIERRAGVPKWVALLALLEEYASIWDRGPRHANQAVLEEAGFRCEAPGCTSRRNLEVHHIVYQSRGGDSRRTNLLVLCRFHHAMGEHGGRMRVTGKAPLDLLWRLGLPQCATWFGKEGRLAARPTPRVVEEHLHAAVT